tara:strand:- start:49 stop:465 length:417 start_codon:yes stop_codon:yes gene_type:complete
MKLLNTVLLLIGLIALVMYLKNLFDIREGVLTASKTRKRRRCPGGYKKNPTHVLTHRKPRSNDRKKLLRNMKTHSGAPVSSSSWRWRKLNKKKNLKVYDYECRPKKSRGGGKNRRQLARGLAQLASGGARHISVNLGR